MHDQEKKAIERATAELFLTAYNVEFNHSYRVVGQPEPPAPDVLCEDTTGGPLKLEITMLQDRPSDIASLLGRSDTHSLEHLREQMKRVNRGEISALDTVADFNRDTMGNLRSRLKAKLTKRHFGPDVALVLRSTSPGDWDWNLHMDDIRALLAGVLHELGLTQHPYDRGIWIVAREEAGIRLYRVEGERAAETAE